MLIIAILQFSQIKYKFKVKAFMLLLSSLFTLIYSQETELQGPYPNSLLLKNGKVFLTNINGIFICDINLENIIKKHDYGSISVNEGNIQRISAKTLIVQFQEENGIIICLVKNILYFFNSEGDSLLFTDNIPLLENINSHPNLITYKKDGEFYHFFVTFINQKDLNIFHYKVNSNEKELIYQGTFKPFYFDFPQISIFGMAIGCQVMNSENKGKVLTCCFQTNKENFIVIQSFIIEKNFESIGQDIYAKIPSPNSEVIHSLVSEDGKKLVTFYLESNIGYYFIFDIDTNQIIKNKPIIKECGNDYNKFKFYYIDETKEYLFICSNNNKQFTIMRMKNDFTFINKNSFSSHNFELVSSFNTFNLIYNDQQSTKYALISDPIINSKKITKLYKITTNFDDDFDGGNLPNPIPDILPSNNIYNLPNNNKYFVETIRYKVPITVNEKDGIFIDFLDENNPLIKTKEDKPINSSIYAINVNNLPQGKLKYIIDNKEIDVIQNERIFGAFKFKYYPPNNYGLQTSITYKVFLRNYSIASEESYYWFDICKQNCSCENDVGSCSSCANGYSYFQGRDRCYSDSDLTGAYKDNSGYYQFCYNKCKTCNGKYQDENNMRCTSCFEEKDEYLDGNICKLITCPNLFYKDKETKMKHCISENECPSEYPIYNEQTKECQQYIPQITEIPSTELSIKSSEIIIDNLSDSHIITTSILSTEIINSQKIMESTLVESTILEDKTTVIESSNLEDKSTIIESSNLEDKSTIIEPSLKDNSNIIDINELTNYMSQIPSTIKQNEINDKPTNKPTIENINTDNLSPSSNIISNSIIEDHDKHNEITDSILSDLKDEKLIQKILDMIHGENNIEDNLEEFNEPNKTYSLLSNIITSGIIDITSGDKDIILKGENYIYQITTSENQKNSNQDSETAIIDLGECEKIIKRNISYEDDPTPLIILKIDIKKEELKSTGVEYEVYNPYTKEKINLDICSDTKITIIAPVKLTSEETSLYDNLNEQGYDLFDANNSFYQDFCTPFTSLDGTDVILKDRKNNYDNENTTLCENSCDYEKVNTKNNKVFCKCDVKNNIDLESDNFNSKKLLDNFCV